MKAGNSMPLGQFKTRQTGGGGKRQKPDYSKSKGIFVPGDGQMPPPSGVMFIGERPGKDEPIARPFPRPFVGMAGKMFDNYLRGIGLGREDVYVTNLVKDYLDEDPTDEEVSRDTPELLDEISCCQPNVICTLGRFATRWVLGDVDMEAVHGIPHSVPDTNVDVLDRCGDVVVVPIYHPAAALYNVDTMPHIVYDFDQLARVLRGEVKVGKDDYPSPLYQELDQCFPFRTNRAAIDTEGLRGSPWCLSYTERAGEGYLVKKRHALDHFHDRIMRAWADPEFRVYLHNSLHDLMILEELNIPIPDGRFVDTMVLAYLLCLEPQGLKALAYRHAGMKMSEYKEIIAEPSQMLAVEWMYDAMRYDWGEAEQYVIIEKGQVKIKKPHSLNRRLTRIETDWQKDNNTDVRHRLSKIWEDSPDNYERLAGSIGDLPEATLDDVPPAIARDYACRDADATLRVAPYLEQRIADMQLDGISAIDHAVIPMFNRMQKVGFLTDVHYLSNILQPKVEARMEELKDAIEKLTGARINPDSPPQTRDLLFTQLGLPSGKLTRGGDASTQDKVLEGLRHSHAVVPLILDYREHSKVRNSFCRVLPRKVGSDSRIRCNLRLTRVSSGRPAANSPNLLAIPVRTKLGKEVRTGFVADVEAGRRLGSWDLDQIEMRGMAHESGDERLCDLFNDGNKDVHRETAAAVFGVKAADVKTGQRYAAKRVGFGVITGITAMGLLDQMKLANTGIDWTEDRCQELIDEWFKMYPKVKGYMLECHAEARRYGYVRDMWGRIRYLPGIHSVIPWIREEAMRQSHSFKISAGAQGLMKRGQAKVWEYLTSWWAAEVGWVEPLLQIYDELIFEFDENMFGLIDAGVTHALTTTTTWRVPVKSKGSMAENWGALKD